MSYENELTKQHTALVAARRRHRTDPLDPEALADLDEDITRTVMELARAKEHVDFLKTSGATLTLTQPQMQPQPQTQWRSPSNLPRYTPNMQVKHFLIKFEAALKAEGIPEERWQDFLIHCFDGADLDLLDTEITSQTRNNWPEANVVSPQ